MAEAGANLTAEGKDAYLGACVLRGRQKIGEGMLCQKAEP